MARHPRPPSPPRPPSDSDLSFDPIEEWLVDFDHAMAGELGTKSFGLGEEAVVPDAPEKKIFDIGEVSDGSVSKSREFGVKEEVVEEDGLLGQFGPSCSDDFDVKKEVDVVSGGLGGELGPDQLPASGMGDLAAEEDISGKVVDTEINAVAVDAEMNTAVSVKVEMEGGSGKEEESSEDESGEASSSSEEQTGKKDGELSEASLSSDEEEQRGKKHGGVGGGKGDDMEAVIEEGELMAGSDLEDAPKGPIKSKRELEVLPPVPKIEVQLEPHHKTLSVGTISAIMGERVIVEGSVQHNPLNEGSILWITESRTPLGIVDELFGPVKNPYYLMRYNSAEEVPAGISVGTAVSFVTEFADHVLNMKELYAKGYDASGDNDEEQTDEPEFSDDEEEAEYKRSLRQARRQTDRQHESKKPSGDKRTQRDKKRRTQRRGAGFQENTPPRTRDAPPPGHQSQPHFHHSDTAPAVADNTVRSLGPQNFPMSPPTMLPPVPMNPALPPAVQLATQMGGCFTNPSHQFLPQQPNMVWPGGLPPQPQQNMGVEGAAFAANIMQNLLIGANQYQQQFQNQNFGGFPIQMPVPSPQQFMPQRGGTPAIPMSFGGPPVDPPFGAASPLPMRQGKFGQPPHMAGDMQEQRPPPRFPNVQGFRHLTPPHADGEQPPMQFNSGQSNQRSSPFRGSRQHGRGRGRHFSRGGGGRHRNS